jgi:hypothetical protein
LQNLAHRSNQTALSRDFFLADEGRGGAGWLRAAERSKLVIAEKFSVDAGRRL